jgi:hypothetical protein
VETSQANTAGNVQVGDRDLPSGTRTSYVPEQNGRGLRYYHQENRTINPLFLHPAEEGRRETTPEDTVTVLRTDSCLPHPLSAADFPPSVESEILPVTLEENFWLMNNARTPTSTDDPYPTPNSTSGLDCGIDSQGNRQRNNNITTAVVMPEYSFTQDLGQVC